jgi:hypothetical protein
MAHSNCVGVDVDVMVSPNCQRTRQRVKEYDAQRLFL